MKSNSQNFIDQIINQTSVQSDTNNKDFLRIKDLTGRRILLYGNGDGYITFKCFVMDKFDIKVERILDTKFSHLSQIDGVPAMAPLSYQPDAEFRSAGLVIITIGKKDLLPLIYENLITLGYKNIITAFQIYEYHLSHADPNFSNQIESIFHSHQQSIYDAYVKLRDAKSRQLFIDILKFYAGISCVQFAHDAIKNQYFPDDVPLKKGFKRVINCGSYDGDTVRQLFNLKGKVDALACFEPDPENYKNLTNYLKINSKTITNHCMAFPCGVYSHNQQLRFSSGDRINSTVNQDGQSLIQCVSLDSALPNFAPTYINMDVEGSEPEALLGARSLIKSSSPDLAICVYHKPLHLWEILHLIHNIDHRYQFYLRNYTGFPAETVLYCVVLD